MKIADTISRQRRKRGMTQEDLAKILGVTKASVSKWETGQSYPDITLLPRLAAYFSITVDELIGYESQLTKEQIKAEYQRLAKAFVSDPPEQVKQQCNQLIQQYYACYPFLLQMAVLYFNHAALFSDPKAIIQEAIRLCRRIKEESQNVWLIKQAEHIEITGYRMVGEPEKALKLMGEEVRPILADTEMMASTYEAVGEMERARKIWQIGVYQHLMLVMEGLTHLMTGPAWQECIRRADGLMALFHLEGLNQNTAAVAFLSMAQIYLEHDLPGKAMDTLERYGQVALHGFAPYVLHGDDFFTDIDSWFEEFELGIQPPRNEKAIRQSLLEAVQQNPAFAPLAGEPRFQALIQRLKEYADS